MVRLIYYMDLVVVFMNLEIVLRYVIKIVIVKRTDFLCVLKVGIYIILIYEFCF